MEKYKQVIEDLKKFLKENIDKTKDAPTGDFDSGINYICTEILSNLENLPLR